MSTRRRVAVVDDDQSVRKALRRLLRAADFEAEAYGSGTDFLDALAAAVPHCLVLDLQMPEMTGLEVQQRLAERGIRLPIVIITGHSEPYMEAKCLAAGAGAYLRKPLDEKVLLAAINGAIAAGSPCGR